MTKTETLILGAGITGLSAAYHLEQKKKDYLLLEKNATAGGLCRSVPKDGFLFDYSGHVLHVKEAYTKKLLQTLLGKNLNFVKRNAFIYLQGTYVPFPFQANLVYLDKDIVKECIDGMLAAEKRKTTKINNFKDWALSVYGDGICKYFMIPYNEKLWTIPASELSMSWCNTFVPKTTTQDIIKGAYFKQTKDFGYNAHFFYPKEDGCAALPNALIKKISNIKINTCVTAVDPDKKIVYTNNGEYEYENLVNTLPLKEFAELCQDTPKAVKDAAERLRSNTVHVLNLGIDRVIKNVSWVYFPEDKYPFYRAGVQSSFAKSVAKDKCSSLYIETSVPYGKKVNKTALEAQIIKGLKDCGLLKDTDTVLTSLWLTIDRAYAAYDKDRNSSVEKLVTYFMKRGVYTIGRYGGWEYSFIEKNLLEGRAIALSL
ncbi:Protoporphyrinogen oxidase [Parelusimicrobium proximum]|uniref:protoporphyrinogen/coproporphyrinogen oxidase n=1 Tax=Parelusimicrobium proximum TaxID=3228953 RepID=UPI003D179599